MGSERTAGTSTTLVNWEKRQASETLHHDIRSPEIDPSTTVASTLANQPLSGSSSTRWSGVSGMQGVESF